MVVKSTLPSADQVEAMMDAQEELFKSLRAGHYQLMDLWRQWLKVLRAGDAIRAYVCEESVYVKTDNPA